MFVFAFLLFYPFIWFHVKCYFEYMRLSYIHTQAGGLHLMSQIFHPHAWNLAHQQEASNKSSESI